MKCDSKEASKHRETNDAKIFIAVMRGTTPEVAIGFLCIGVQGLTSPEAKFLH